MVDDSLLAETIPSWISNEPITLSNGKIASDADKYLSQNDSESTL